MIRVVELFAGIGAQRKALERIGIEHEVLGISEIDKHVLKVYEALYGKTENFGDIRNIEQLPKADLWTYSFPCTDISLAGGMRGMEKGSETSSSLLWEVERLLTVAKDKNTLPKILLMENVKNLVSKKFINDFNEWCRFLRSLGYTNSWKILNAKDYGIPQNRERVFMVSILGCGYEFPDKMPLTSKLSDYLEDQVDDKYFMSEKLIETFTDLENRNGYIRGLRFRHLEQTAEHSWTITTKNTRPTDNYIIVPENTKRGYTSAEIGDGVL